MSGTFVTHARILYTAQARPAPPVYPGGGPHAGTNKRTFPIWGFCILGYMAFRLADIQCPVDILK